MEFLHRMTNFIVAASILIAAMGLALVAPRPALSSRADALEMLQFTSGGQRLGFDAAGMLVATGIHALRVEFVNANRTEPASASTEGGAFASTTYANLWDGVTLTYDAVGIVRSTYEVAAGANANAIRLRYNRPVQLLADGSLRVAFEDGTMTESAPIAWQEMNGKRQSVAVAFRQFGKNEIGFNLGAYDRSHPLFIDPVLTWNTFLGSSVFDSIDDMVMDANGSIFVTGTSSATWGSPVRAYAGGKDVFVAKLTNNGTLVWHTFLGSSATDQAGGIALRTDGAYVYVTGSANGNWGSPIRPYVWIYDIFAASLDTLDGTLSWHTFLGGFGDDYGSDLVTTDSGIYIIGYGSATWGGPITAYAGGANDAALIKLNLAGVLFWNTFMGSTGDDYGYGIDNDTTVNIDASLYVTGYSNATWGASPVNAYTGANDAFVAKFNNSGARLWNTFMGSSAEDYGYNLVTDPNGATYVVGSSGATWGTPINAFAGAFDGFAAQLTANGSRVWNTFLGSSTQDQANAVALDSDSNVYVAGFSDASWGAPINPHGGGLNDAFIGVLNSSGARQRNTFVGGNGGDTISSILVASTGRVLAAGQSNATWGSPINPLNGNYDGFVAMFYPVKSLTEYSTGGNDGWVLESNETSGVGGSMNAAGTTFNVGDGVGDKQYRSILSFNTASLPNTAVIIKVVLKIKKQGQVGADPFATLGALRVDIHKTGFGGAFSLAPSDFEAAAGKSNIASIANNPVNNWYTRTWTTNTFFAFINRAGNTQFRLRFLTDDNDNGAADYIKFFSGNQATLAVRPILTIEYYVP